MHVGIRDVLFEPGWPGTRKILQRDTKGKITEEVPFGRRFYHVEKGHWGFLD